MSAYGTKYGSLAQLGEHLPYKQEVIGSIPIAPTKVRMQKHSDFFIDMMGLETIKGEGQ